MAVKEKYKYVIDLVEQKSVGGKDITETANKLNIKATVNTPYDKNLIWDKIKEIGGQQPSDLVADIKVQNNDVFAFHTVERGETLGKISKKYLGDSNKYNEIARFNNISDPDKIQIGQQIKIPNS